MRWDVSMKAQQNTATRDSQPCTAGKCHESGLQKMEGIVESVPQIILVIILELTDPSIFLEDWCSTELARIRLVKIVMWPCTAEKYVFMHSSEHKGNNVFDMHAWLWASFSGMTVAHLFWRRQQI